MKKIVLLVVALLVVVTLYSKNNYQEGEHSYSIQFAGENRTFVLYIPKSIKPNAPLIFVLHGYGGTSKPSKYPFYSVADREGVAICYPQGEKDIKGKSCWNVGYPSQDGLKRDDNAFILFLAHHLQKQCNLSKENTFVAGMSNGGEMCYQLAFECPNSFAAFAPVSGLTMEKLYKTHTAKHAVPIMEIHGTEDRTSEWTGDPTNKGGWGKYIAVPLAIGYWVAVNRSTHEIIEHRDPITPTGHHIIIHKFVGGENEVWLYEIVGAKHSWHAKDINTAEEIWQFFSKYLK